MQPLTPEQLFAKYEKMPKDLQNAILSAETSGVIDAIAKKYGLNIEQTGNLADEIGLLMLGETHPSDFINNLNRRLGADPETTKKIAQEINEQIFSKVKESLRKIHAVDENEAAAVHAPATPAPSPQQVRPQTIKSPFEQKLEEKVFKPAERPLVKEVEEARKENRYPQSADPYIEPPK